MIHHSHSPIPLGLVLAVILLALAACPKRSASAEDYAAERRAMVKHQVAARGVTDKRVLAAMSEVKRHLFVPPEQRDQAYDDHPLAIGQGQTISQPYIVAAMTEALELEHGDKVLEIGTGSGYQAAVLGELAGQVYTIEIVPELAETARTHLQQLGYTNVVVRQGDGYKGWPERAPFDLILVTAAPEEIPPPLLDQLAAGGRLVAPVGAQDEVQQLTVVTKDEDGIQRKQVMPVRFVPFQRKEDDRG
jgi:protein-L-isoaspartate(D-aspartate) O-methyltransferase